MQCDASCCRVLNFLALMIKERNPELMRAARERRSGHNPGIRDSPLCLIDKECRPVKAQAPFKKVTCRLEVCAVAKDERERTAAGKMLAVPRKGQLDLGRLHYVVAGRHNLYGRRGISRSMKVQVRSMRALGERVAGGVRTLCLLLCIHCATWLQPDPGTDRRHGSWVSTAAAASAPDRRWKARHHRPGPRPSRHSG